MPPVLNNISSTPSAYHSPGLLQSTTFGIMNVATPMRHPPSAIISNSVTFKFFIQLVYFCVRVVIRFSCPISSAMGIFGEILKNAPWGAGRMWCSRNVKIDDDFSLAWMCRIFLDTNTAFALRCTYISRKWSRPMVSIFFSLDIF